MCWSKQQALFPSHKNGGSACQLGFLMGVSMRMFLLLSSLAALTGCAPPTTLPPQGGVGFGDRPVYVAPGVASAPVVPPAASNAAIPSSEINSALFGTTTAPGAEAAPLPSYVPPANPQASVQTSEAELIASLPGHSGISDEQDFEAVASRETIETDAERIEANKAQYQQIAPAALPERGAGQAVSDLVSYALNAPNRLGQSIYQRRSVAADAHRKACLHYASDEAAQVAFLKAGGPERDRKKLDPDGDGFACDWDPTPFQKARGG